MAEKKNIPALRFPEFEGEWDKNLFGNIASFSKGKGISKADIVEDGDTECVRYGELYTIYNEVIDNVKSKTNIPVEDLILSDKNDVIIPASGETQIDIARASCVIREGVALGGDLNIIKSKLDGVYLAYYLNNPKKKEIAAIAQGNSVVHLYSSQLKSLDINYPKPEEQTKIATFLTAIDKRINLLSKQKVQLELYKKGLMHKIFNQELRFKDENGKDFPEWKEKRLGEIALKRSSNISANSLSENHGSYKIYGATGFLQNIDFFREEEAYISIIKDGAGVGRLFLCEPYTSVLGTLDIINIKDDTNLYFLYLLLSTIDFTKYITGSTIPHIYFKDYSKEKLIIPSPAEQIKIASFLTEIDLHIEKSKYQIEESIEYKKSLLQKLFV